MMDDVLILLDRSKRKKIPNLDYFLLKFNIIFAARLGYDYKQGENIKTHNITLFLPSEL